MIGWQLLLRFVRTEASEPQTNANSRIETGVLERTTSTDYFHILIITYWVIIKEKSMHLPHQLHTVAEVMCWRNKNRMNAGFIDHVIFCILHVLCSPHVFSFLDKKKKSATNLLWEYEHSGRAVRDEWIWVNENEISSWQPGHLLCNLATFTLLTSILMSALTDFPAASVKYMHYLFQQPRNRVDVLIMNIRSFLAWVTWHVYPHT